MNPAPHLRAARWLALAAAVSCAVIANPGAVEARPRPARTAEFQANKVFGLGIMLGSPTGLSGKYYLSDSTALDFGVGAVHRWRYRSALQIHADFLWHPVVLATTDPFLLPLYFGIGGRLLDHDDYRDDYEDGTHLGVRAPLGILMDFNTVPIDIFFELALVVDVISDDDHGYVDFVGAIGARYYF